MPQNPEHIAVNDLMGKPPGWLLRSGITLVFIIVIAGLVLSAFIHYPDEINGSTVVQRERTPIALVPAVTTFIDTLFVKDGEEIRSNEIIAVLHSDANWQEVIALESILDRGSEGGYHDQLTELGVLQSIYARWVASETAYAHYRENNPTQKSIAHLQKEIAYTQKLIEISREERLLVEQALALEKGDYERQLKLAAEGVISAQELEEKEKAWLSLQQQGEALKARAVEYDLRINSIEQQVANLQAEDGDKGFGLQQSYQQLTEELSGKIQEWKATYLLIAPMGGRVVFTGDLMAKQQVSPAMPLLYLEPFAAERTALLAKISIPGSGLGKISKGDQVIIRLDAYPEKEYGTINTRIEEIKELPTVDAEGNFSYQVIAPLDEPLETTYNKRLPLGLQMNGTATIITKDRSVLTRVFEQLLTLIGQN